MVSRVNTRVEARVDTTVDARMDLSTRTNEQTDGQKLVGLSRSC